MIVLALVTTEGGPFSVGDAAADANDDDARLSFESELVSELKPERELSLATLLLSPVSWTDQALGPPPVTHLAGIKRRVLNAAYMYPGCIRYISSCTPNPRLCCWTLEGDHHTSS